MAGFQAGPITIGCPHPISHMGGGGGVASDNNTPVNLKGEINHIGINHIGSYSYQNIIEIRNM